METVVALSKETISDLKSYIQRKQETALALRDAQIADIKAQSDLDQFIHYLQYPKKEIK